MAADIVLIVPFMELKFITTMSTTMSSGVLIVPFMELKSTSTSMSSGRPVPVLIVPFMELKCTLHGCHHHHDES